jgi:two-component system chemotaxis response regulator CheY
MREILKAILRDEGYSLFGEAKDGQAALAQLDRGRPDLICLDVNMPGLSGLDVLREINQRVPGTPVLMVTGDASMNTVREAVSLGAVGYLIKPFNGKRVADSLRAALKASSANTFG